MADVVLDASAFIDVLAVGSPAALEAYAAADAFLVPAHFGLEAINAARRLERRGLLAASDVMAIAELAQGEAIVPVDMGAFLGDIASMRHNFAPFDAAYVLLAQATGLALLTADRRLARAAEGWCTVHLV